LIDLVDCCCFFLLGRPGGGEFALLGGLMLGLWSACAGGVGKGAGGATPFTVGLVRSMTD